MDTLHKDRLTFFYHISLISSSNYKYFNKSSRKNKTHILCSITFFSENRAVYEIMWQNIVQQGGPHNNMAHAQCMLDT